MHKTPMYACIVFFPDGTVKRWKYVRDLNSFSLFLNREHFEWKYFNVYGKGDKLFIKRFYPGNLIPKVLRTLVFFLCQLTTFNTCEAHTYEKTFEKATFSKTTFNNGFNNGATFSNLFNEKGGISWL